MNEAQAPNPKQLIVEYPSGDFPEQLPHYIIRLKSKEIVNSVSRNHTKTFLLGIFRLLVDLVQFLFD